jgi:DNA-binding CsgD family transcriptional regulator
MGTTIEKSLKWTGVFLGSLFAIGTIIRAVQLFFQLHMPLMSVLTEWGMIVLTLSTIGLFLSAFWKPAVWFQPFMFFSLMPLPFLDNAQSLYGLGFFVMGVLLLFRLGFYERYRLLKLICSIAYLYFWEIWSALKVGRNLISAFTPVFFVTALLLMLYVAFSEKLMVYLKEPKQKLSLREKTLSEAERAYVMALLKDGKNYKEIAFDFEVSESTVRNTLARAYKKLDISDHMGLVNLANQYDIVD